MRPLRCLGLTALALFASACGGESPWAKVPSGQYQKTASRLQYAVIQPGTGQEAQDGDYVQMQYTGWLRDDGSKFDSTLDHGGQPFGFQLGVRQVIAGWDEGVKGMKIGEKRQLLIPPNLGYGANGSPPAIPPNASLVFDVELVGIPSTATPMLAKPEQYRTIKGGLKYAVIKPGDGDVAKRGKIVIVHYSGWVKGGKRFDSSYTNPMSRGQPLTVPLGARRVIDGWELGLPGMKAGEKRQLLVPPSLAYGPKGQPEAGIPPHATLIFDVELLGVQ